MKAFPRWPAEDLGWDDATGLPGIGLFGQALLTWVVAQPHPVSVADAAATFDVPAARVAEAIAPNPCLALLDEDGVPDPWRLISYDWTLRGAPPSDAALRTALRVWFTFREHPLTVSVVASVFHVPPPHVLRAARSDPWLRASGSAADLSRCVVELDRVAA